MQKKAFMENEDLQIALNKPLSSGNDKSVFGNLPKSLLGCEEEISVTNSQGEVVGVIDLTNKPVRI
jgi:hypothetical protein